MQKVVLIALLAQVFSACVSTPEKTQAELDAERAAEYQATRYHVQDDFSPVLLLKPETIRDAIPHKEEIRKAGNKSPYTVLGKTYEVMPDPNGYKERGGASWYGLKFHGHQTSNGEIYSIYGMTAAHKTLPIPSYVKVTNLANGRSAIVRVNDRGPFHPGRIIDLSYAAATKLGYIEMGTAQVDVEYINPDQWQPASTMALADSVVLQVGAYSQQNIAEFHYKKLYAALTFPVMLEQGKDQLYRLRVGPIAPEQEQQARAAVMAQGYPSPTRVKNPAGE